VKETEDFYTVVIWFVIEAGLHLPNDVSFVHMVKRIRHLRVS